MKTLGGRQFWADVRFFRGWRIQRHVFTGHFRLLDPRNYRHDFGSFDACLATLEDIKRREKLPPMSGKAVIAIHGILHSSRIFGAMVPALEQAGFTVIAFDYPSSRIEIGPAAAGLKQLVDSLEGIEEINFVVHSMGGLVTRSYLKGERDPRIHRMVMLGVPNHGAEMADLMRKNYAYRFIFGPAGQQLVTGAEGVISSLPIPDFEFATIAGARGHRAGFNPLIPGDDDIVVTVASARLPGATDSMTIRAFHRFIPANVEVIDATVRFLQTGCLRKDGLRQPIPREMAAEQPVPIGR